MSELAPALGLQQLRRFGAPSLATVGVLWVLSWEGPALGRLLVPAVVSFCALVGGVRRDALLQPPGLLFHWAASLVALFLLSAVSVPGIDFFGFLFGAYALGIAAVIWLVRLLAFGIATTRGRSKGRIAWFMVAPMGAVVTLLLLATSAPFEARWALSRPAFEAAVRDLPPESPSRPGFLERNEVPGCCGLYSVHQVSRYQGAVAFRESTGDFVDDAGFLYSPDGYLPQDIGEAPQYRHIGGPWYAWTASW